MKKTNASFLSQLLISLVAVAVVYGVYYALTFKKVVVLPGTPTETTLTILVPNDIPAYTNAMNEYTSMGGENPVKTWPFVAKTITVATSGDIIKQSAEAAAKEIEAQGGPTYAKVTYFKVQDSIAYVLLDIDLDGWAGVSFSVNRIHPIIEMTLLQFPEIASVKFGYAPGDEPTVSN